jgi:Ni/Co efflux regulator RcnB
VRRLILCIAAAACLAGPMISAGPALAQRWDHDGRGDRGDRGDNRRWDRGDRDGRWEHNRGERRGDRDGRWDRGDRDGRWGRGDGERWRDARGERNWDNDDRRGPPRDFQNFSPRRGAYLPRGYDGGYVVDDYRRFRLRTPPPGYHWVRVRDDYLLVAIASGLIFDIISGGY